MKRFFNILITSLLLAALVVLLVLAERSHKKQLCKGFEIELIQDSEYELITQDEVNDLVIQLNDSIVGRPINNIDLELISSSIDEIPYIERADIFTTINGIFKLRIISRSPIARLINENNQTALLDKSGMLIPYRRNHPVRVLIISGHIKNNFDFTDTKAIDTDDLEDESTIRNIATLALMLNDNTLLKHQIDQVYVNKEHEFDLLPKVGTQLIEFGSIDNAEKKLRNLVLVYKNIFPQKGWDYYSSVSIKYDNQIVCTK